MTRGNHPKKVEKTMTRGTPAPKMEMKRREPPRKSLQKLGVERHSTKSLWKPDMPMRAYKLALLGMTNKEMAQVLGITIKTFESWIIKVPEFYKAITAGRTEADTEVAASLYKAATGFEYDEKRWERRPVINPQTGEKEYQMVLVETTRKMVNPNPTSMIFWLKNRTRHLEQAWNDVHRLEHTGKGGVPLEKMEEVLKKAGDMTTEELTLLNSLSKKLLSGQTKTQGQA